MAASYPTSVKSFTTRSTNQTIAAAHVNDLQDEVAAIETALLGSFTHNLTIIEDGLQLYRADSARYSKLYHDTTGAAWQLSDTLDSWRFEDINNHAYVTMSSAASIEIKGANTVDATLTLSADNSDDTGDTWHIRSNASDNRLTFLNESTEIAGLIGTNIFRMTTTARGTGAAPGPSVEVGRNSSGSGAAGSLMLTQRGGTAYYLWVDATGDLRIHTAPPTENNTTVSDTAGTVVGTQS